MTSITDLRENVRGQVLEAGDEGYDEHRMVHNFMHDRRPAVIVRATDTADVVAAVRYARATSSSTSRSAAGVTACPVSAPVTAAS